MFNVGLNTSNPDYNVIGKGWRITSLSREAPFQFEVKTSSLNTLAQSHILDVSNGTLDDIEKEAMDLQTFPEIWGSFDRAHIVQDGLFHTSRTIH